MHTLKLARQHTAGIVVLISMITSRPSLTKGSTFRRSRASSNSFWSRAHNLFVSFGPNGEFNRDASVLNPNYVVEKTGNMSNLATCGGTALADQRRNQALDRNGVGYLGDLLFGRISADGKTVSAVHYGKQLLEQIDPNEYGRGLSGRTVPEINLSHEPG